MKTPIITALVLFTQSLFLFGLYEPYDPEPAVTNGPNAPSGSATIAEIDGVSLNQVRTTALLKHFPAHVPIELNLTNHNTDLNPLVLELPSGTNAIRISSGTPLNTTSYQKFNGEFLQLEGAGEPGEGVTEFDDGPRVSIPLTRIPSGGGSSSVVITTDTPKCACTETTCSKTGTTPEVEPPATSLSPIGIIDSFPLGLTCCTSGQIPGTAVWAPGDLTTSWNDPTNVIALPNSEMLTAETLKRVNVGNTEQWRTEASLVEIVSDPDKLTITTYLDPPLSPSGGGLYDSAGLCELARTEIETGPNPGELAYASYF